MDRSTGLKSPNRSSEPPPLGSMQQQQQHGQQTAAAPAPSSTSSTPLESRESSPIRPRGGEPSSSGQPDGSPTRSVRSSLPLSTHGSSRSLGSAATPVLLPAAASPASAAAPAAKGGQDRATLNKTPSPSPRKQQQHHPHLHYLHHQPPPLPSSSPSSPSPPPPPHPPPPPPLSLVGSAAAAADPSRHPSPRWSTPPRLRSPPPYSPQLTATGGTAPAPAISLQRATPSPRPSTDSLPSVVSESDVDEPQRPRSGSRTPAQRGSPSTLETVAEVSLPNSPGAGDKAALDRIGERLSSIGEADTEIGPASESEKPDDHENEHYDPTDNQDQMQRTPTQTPAALPAIESGSEGGAAGASGNGHEPEPGAGAGAGPRPNTAALRDRRRAMPTGPSPPPLLSRQSSALSTAQLKPRGKEELVGRNMTVETETVEVQQPNALPGLAAAGGNILRTKPSSETIRPKRDKKRAGRKLPTVNPLSASSKADNFEAKIASAVDEANTSDSEETFVYDSNPPENDRQRRFHSRTPSATSMISSHQAGPGPAERVTNLRSIYSVLEVPGQQQQQQQHQQPPQPGTGIGRKGAKFVNTTASGGETMSSSAAAVEEDGRGPGRAGAGGGGSSGAPGSARNSSSSRPHHYGRWGRSNHGNTSHPSSLLEPEPSPFLSAQQPVAGTSKSKISTGNGSHSPRYGHGGPHAPPPSPRNHRFLHGAVTGGAGGGGSGGAGTGKRSPIQISSTYDLDDADQADSERTPLLLHGSMRSSRSGRSRRQYGRPHPSHQHQHQHPSIRQMEEESQQCFRQRQSYLNRFAACLVVTIMVFLGITGAIGFMFATSQPMSDIELIGIKNVLASEPELMFDLTLKAHNPNIVVVTIDQADLEIFAKSIHAGTDADWHRHPEGPPDAAAPSSPFIVGGPPRPGPAQVGVLDDPPYDEPLPPPDDEAAPNMKLGNIDEFDSPLSFEGSFFNHGWSESTGEVRLRGPGNSTAGGSTRWGRILENEFDLIVKGVVRYTLPFSSRVRSSSVSGRTTVKPNSANDPSLRPNTTMPGDI